MKAFFALFRRELFSLAVAPYVYLLLAIWFLLNGMVFIASLERPAVQNDLTLLPQVLFGSQGLLMWLLIPVFPPLITLRLFAEEQRLGTLEALLTAPISDAAVVLAKYLAACLFFLLFWGGVLLLFLLLQWQGAPIVWSRAAGGFLGALLTSYLFLGAGLFLSSWSGNLVLAAGGGAAANYFLLILPALLSDVPGPTGAVARAIFIPGHLDKAFAAGLLDSFAVAYFLLGAGLFVFLTWVRLVSRRWVP
ncbi:MAG: hypothetical protein DWQ01_12655 [Planctomycetota bacterium]|nr:MAG: hypothetical protein DWQ01_12655 [Planctomycetota bacterium]